MVSYILEVKELKKYYPVKRGLFYKTVDWIKAVDGVSFSLVAGKTLGLVGESGCGKTTLAKIILRLIELDEGKIYFSGQELTELNAREIRLLRKDLQIVFQNPFNSLDPRFTVAKIIQEGLREFRPKENKKEIFKISEKILQDVGLCADALSRFPHEFSGGERQRISIARALILNPKMLVLDEPVSALDVSVGAQIINLLLKLQEELGLTYLFIAHDLNVIRYVSDEVLVMYLGRIVERAPSSELFQNPLHPYTKLLLSCLPSLKREEGFLREKEKEFSVSFGEKGCRFWKRCKFKQNSCSDNEPDLKEVKNNHWVRCHLWFFPGSVL